MISATVRVNGRVVGRIDRYGDDEDHRFTFESGWLDDPERPVLGQQFEDRLPDPMDASGLPAWFAHLIPQGPWKRYLQRAAGLSTDAPDLAFLLAIGDDLPGAVTLEVASPALTAPLTRRQTSPVTGALGFSLAGAQSKLSVRDGDRGLVVPAQGNGPGGYIAKFHDPTYPHLVLNEFLTWAWARDVGVHVPDFRLGAVADFEQLPVGLDTGDGRVFISCRFDRSQRARVHSEDFGQVSGRAPGDPGQYTGSYEELVTLVRVLTPVDLPELIRRIAFMLVCGNGDAHLKNWALLYPDGRRPRLAPAYDLVSTVSYPRLGQELALTLGGTKAFADLSLRPPSTLARAAGFSEAELARVWNQGVEATYDTWRATRNDWPNALRERIDLHLKRLRAR